MQENQATRKAFIAENASPREDQAVSIFRLLFAGCCMVATIAPSAAADANHGKEISTRWCASCHLIERGQTSATDQAPPFTYLAKTPEFNEQRLAFLLLLPHPNMPNLSLNRADVADLADYIRSLK
jgi:mono/diheme cytochrome c family protein